MITYTVDCASAGSVTVEAKPQLLSSSLLARQPKLVARSAPVAHEPPTKSTVSKLVPKLHVLSLRTPPKGASSTLTASSSAPPAVRTDPSAHSPLVLSACAVALRAMGGSALTTDAPPRSTKLALTGHAGGVRVDVGACERGAPTEEDGEGVEVGSV
jgi:hypothetical protein